MTKPPNISLQIQEMNYRYPGSDWELQISEFSIQSGELKTVIGPNGSGKSTFLKCLAGIHPVSKNCPQINAIPINVIPRKEIAKSIGYLPQYLPSDFNYRVEDLVAMGRYPHLKGSNYLDGHDHDVLKRCMAITDTLSLSHRHIFQLSGGERQRVFLASVLAQEPSLLLFDEPTTALDIHHQVQFLQIVQELSSNGIAVVLVTHDINLASSVSNQIVLLNQGSIVLEGSPNKVLTADILDSIYGDDLYFTQHPLMNTPWVLPKFDTARN